MGLRATLAGGMTALGLVLAATPAHAQQTTPTNQVTPTPTPSPTPSTRAIGNPALENFDLGNSGGNREPRPSATIPAPAPSTPTPAPTRSSSAPPDRAPSVTPAPAPTREAPSAATRSTPAERITRSAPPSTISAPEAIAPAPETATPDPSATLMPPADPATGGPSLWPWLAALAVALAGAGAWWVRRKHGEGEALAFAGPPVSEPAPPTAPMPEPARAPALPPAPRASSDGTIVSRALQPKLAFDLVPMLFETDEAGHARLTFELVIANLGGAPARDIQVEAKMFNAGPTQDAEIGQFFRVPGRLGAKLPPLAPQERMPLRSRVSMAPGDYQALDMAGRALLVPMVAVNAVYRGSSGQSQESASWLVGRPPTGDKGPAKLGPFALGKPQSASKLASLQHSTGINR